MQATANFSFAFYLKLRLGHSRYEFIFTCSRNGFVCTKIFRRDPHVVELQMGMMTRKLDDACHSNHFDSNRLQYLTLTCKYHCVKIMVPCR
jgi:hypothetical protein